jgi:molybdopterin molybdotransferase
MISIEEALTHIIDACPTLDAETIPAQDAVGRVLRQEIVAPTDYPPFDRVMMDGYALRVADLQGNAALPLHGEVAAGTDEKLQLRPGSCAEVMTGAPLPLGADAVVKVEQTERKNGWITFNERVREGQHFAPAGEEAHRGDVLLRPGDVISAVSVATAASAGHAQLKVSRQPSLVAVSTGNELVDVDRQPGPNQIRDTNSLTLAAQATAHGLTHVRRRRARDTLKSLQAVLDDALTEDIVILSGGVSMGRYDLVPKALESRGVEQVFHRVLQKPGKPLWFGRRKDTLVFGAPGNPLSTLLTFQLYVKPAIARMTGRSPHQPMQRGTLVRDVTYRSKRHLWAFVHVAWVGDTWRVTPLPGRGSADVFAPAVANAVISMPAGAHEFAGGDEVSFHLLHPEG